MIGLKFGDKVTVRNKLKRSGKRKYPEDGGFSWIYKFWDKVDIQEKEGIYLGKRTLSNGNRHLFSDHIEYYPEEYITAYLVCTSENKNPFYTTEIETL